MQFWQPCRTFLAVSRNNFFESPEEIKDVEFFRKKNHFPWMFAGLLEYPFDNPVYRTLSA